MIVFAAAVKGVRMYDASELEFDNVSSNSERVMYYVIV